MSTLNLTKGIIYAAALDAAERSKRKRNIAYIDAVANDAYHAEFDRLFAAAGGPEGWMELPS